METFWINGQAKTNEIEWKYDAAGRLTDEIFDHYDPSLDFAEHYDFDLTGNRLRKTLDTGEFPEAGISDGTVDEAIWSLYDVNDRLLQEQLDTVNDSTVDQTTTYDWNGTQQASKSVAAAGAQHPASTQTFTYNLQGRMSGIVLRDFDSTGQLTRSQTLGYNYGADGIRISSTDATDSDGNGFVDSRTKTEFLIDARNATGYQQVLQEVTTNSDTGAEISRVVYTIGLDQISQTTYTNGGSEGTTLFFHTDGHGSTRVLTDVAGAITTVAGALQLFHFDAYGNPLGFNPAQAATSFLYNNEQRDPATGVYNFRARPYDPLNGRLPTSDPYFGKLDSPQSFHKYAFVHGDPIQGIDPTGLFTAVEMMSVSATSAQVRQADAGPKFSVGVAAQAGIQQAAIQSSTHAAMAVTGATGWSAFEVQIVQGIMTLFAAMIASVTLRNILDQQIQVGATGPVHDGGGGGGGGGGNPSCNCVQEFDAVPVDRLGRAIGAGAVFGGGPIVPGRDFDAYPHWWNESNLPTTGGQRWRRGHLIAASLGGSGGVDFRNLAAIHEYTNNAFGTRGMRGFEDSAKKAAMAGECIIAFVIPVFLGDGYSPDAIVIEALGNKGYRFEHVIPNRARP